MALMAEIIIAMEMEREEKEVIIAMEMEMEMVLAMDSAIMEEMVIMTTMTDLARHLCSLLAMETFRSRITKG
jgi:hypothetical protein